MKYVDMEITFFSLSLSLSLSLLIGKQEYY